MNPRYRRKKQDPVWPSRACAATRWRSCGLRVSPSMGTRDGVPGDTGRRGLRRLHAVRPEAPDRHRLRRAGRPAGFGWLRAAVRAGGDGQSAVAHRRLHRPYLRRGHRRYTARPVPPFLRTFAKLFRRAPAGSLASRISATSNAASSPRTPAPATFCHLRGSALSIVLIGSST